ncbi:MAG: PIG-L family deacetylase [Elusimicrobia bacterium]|nr:PIG-L family deacetylase [Elusimicrobiota bacterium]
MASLSEKLPVLSYKYTGTNVLAIGAHPDDIELGAGGTVARLAAEGARVTMLVVCTPNHLESRMSEAARAAGILGAKIRFLYRERPMRVEDIKNYELVEQIDNLVRQADPSLILTHADSNFHLDHVLVYQACRAAQRLHFFDMLCFYPISCHPVSTRFNPQVHVDISRTLDKKMAAIHEHKTQLICRGLATNHYVDVARHYGRLAGVEYAEGLEVSRLSLG